MKQSQSYHQSVMLLEAIEALSIKKDGVYVDATFGGGGHSRAILSKLGNNGRLIAFDHDKDAWKNAIEDERFSLIKENFRYVKHFLKYLGVPEVDGILADLGVSSHQFDTPERGFSIRWQAKLDMRMDDRIQTNAAHLINTKSELDLQKIFEQYGEVRNAKTLAATIVSRRHLTPITTVASLKKVIEDCVWGNPNKYLAQVFQALRIEVNEEMKSLETFLMQSKSCLKKNGRLCVITFHSIEDRMVKTFMKNGGHFNIQKDEFGRKIQTPVVKPVIELTPSVAEIKLNNRSRSARLRVAEKI